MNTIIPTVTTQRPEVGSLWTDTSSGFIYLLSLIPSGPDQLGYVAINLASGERWDNILQTPLEAVHRLTPFATKARITIEPI